jgi:low affinity Fe/Cu permease
MSTAALRLQYQAVQSKVAALNVFSPNWKMIYMAAFAISLVMLVVYIFGINALTEGTYSIKSYNKQIKSLMAQNSDLQIQSTQSSYLGLTEQKARELNFQKSSNITYVQVMEGSFAKAK